METSCNTIRIEMMFIWYTERLLSCVPVCEIPLFSPLPTTTSLLSADNVTRGTSEIDTNCRSSLGRHLQTIPTLYPVTNSVTCDFHVCFSILCLFIYPFLFALFHCTHFTLQLGLVMTNILMSASQLFITYLSTLWNLLDHRDLRLCRCQFCFRFKIPRV